MRFWSCRYLYRLSILAENALKIFSFVQCTGRNSFTYLYHRLHKLVYLLSCVEGDVIKFVEGDVIKLCRG